jgi:uncharacterized protein (DUF1697 family)
VKVAAMLRGINLGKRQLAKAELIAAAESLGYTEVRTLLASGNLVFEAGDAAAETIERDLHAAVDTLYGLKSEVFVRTLADLEAVIAANPFPDAAEAHPNWLLVTFHHAPFPAALLDAVADGYDGPERLAAHGRELFVEYPESIGHSKLEPITRKLKFPHGTGRNWNTVTKLAAMLA